MKRYKIRQDGEWMYWARKGHLLACCDCGLVHLMRPKVEKGRVYVQAFRLPLSTGGKRSHLTRKARA